MKLSCKIIKDLLPLYAEGMVSGDSREAIEEHIGGCDDCREELAALRQETVVPTRTDTAPLEHLERNIRRRRISAAVLSILVTAALLFSHRGAVVAGGILPVGGFCGSGYGTKERYLHCGQTQMECADGRSVRR